MLRLALFLSMLFGINTMAQAEKVTVYTQPFSETAEMWIEVMNLEDKLFVKNENDTTEMSNFNIVDVDEEVPINFNVNNYLPDDFNPLAGKNDINWNDLELIELEEEVELNFDPYQYLPNGFDPYEGIELIYYQSLIGL